VENLLDLGRRRIDGVVDHGPDFIFGGGHARTTNG
jgi:hypothetical protein